MERSPFDLIKDGARGIIDKGKQFFAPAVNVFTPRPSEVRLPFSDNVIRSNSAPITTASADLVYRALEAIPKSIASLYGEARGANTGQSSVPIPFGSKIGIDNSVYQTKASQQTEAINKWNNVQTILKDMDNNPNLQLTPDQINLLQTAESPVQSGIRLTSEGALDAIIVGDIARTVAGAFKNLIFPKSFSGQYNAWVELGRPKTVDDVNAAVTKTKTTYRDSLLTKQPELKNDAALRQTEFAKISNKVDEAADILRQSGIPKFGDIRQKVATILEPITRVDDPITSLFKSGQIDDVKAYVKKSADDIASGSIFTPRAPTLNPAPIAGELPGTAIIGTPRVGGLSTRPVRKVGGADVLKQEAKKYKSVDEFIDSLNLTKQSKPHSEIQSLVRNIAIKEFGSSIRLPENEFGVRTNSDAIKSWEERIQKGETPIVYVGGDFSRVIDGANRLQAYKNLGYEEVPTVFQSQLKDVWDEANKSPLPASTKKDIRARLDEVRGTEQSVESLISKNLVRVVSRNGRDQYQYLTADGFKNAADESTAISRVLNSKEPVSTKIPLPDELENKFLALEFKKDALRESPMNSPDNRLYVNKEGSVKELGDIPRTARKTIIKLESRIQESGYEDPTEFAEALDDFLTQKKNVIKEERALREEAKRYKQEQREKLLSNKQVLRSESPLPKSKVQPLQASEGEVRSLEKAARTALAEEDFRTASESFSLLSIIDNTMTPVNKKVGLLDFIRTPDRVLQKIGLGKEYDTLRTQYDKYVKELPKNIDKISAWIERIPAKEANERIFRYLDGENITLSGEELAVAKEIQAWLKEWATRLGLPDDNRIQYYITHLFDDQLIKKEFDEDLAKIIADKIPGSVYDPFLEKRLGAQGYKKDTWAALDAYVKRATRKVHMDPALADIADKAQFLEKTQFDYIKSKMDNINMRPTDFDNSLDNSIKTIVGYRFGQRPVTTITRTLRRLTYRGTLGLNLTSALRNLSQGVNTYSVLGEKYTVIGYMKMLNKNNWKELEEEGIWSNDIIQDRVLSATKKNIQRLDKTLFFFFETVEKLNRGSAYYGAKAKALALGKTEEEAVKYAKEIVRKTQFTFSALDTPVALQSDVAKTLLQLQTFTVKQTEFLFEMLKDKNFVGLGRYLIGGLVFLTTIGKLFGMEPKEFLPTLRFGAPPALKLPIETVKAVLDTPDKYGADRDLEKKASDIGKAAIPFIPAGSQLKRTYDGIQAVKAGGSFDKGGKLQFEVGITPSQKVQAILFGKYSSQNAKAYFNKAEDNEEAMRQIAPVYNDVVKLTEQGQEQEALDLYNSLSDSEKADYKEYRTKTKTQATVQGKKDILPVYQEAVRLIEEGKGKEALDLYNGLSEDEKRYYKLVRDQVKRDGVAQSGGTPKYDDGDAQTERSVVSTVLTYAKAIGVSPIVAFNRIFTGQKIRYVSNGTVVVERLPLVKSQEIKEKLGGKNIEMKLDHTIPLQLGGSNSESNLRLVPTEVWSTYTPIENAIGQALRDGKIERDQAQELIKDFKKGVITADDVYQAIEK